MKITVLTKNPHLGQKLNLCLCATNEVTVDDSFTFGADLYIVDTDTVEPPEAKGGARVITAGRYGRCDLPLPCAFDEILSAVNRAPSESADLILTDRAVYLRGEKIKLTELEYSLLQLLADTKGDFVSREQILEQIWQNDADEGIINVYIHYLRRKLEKGEKIILSSRQHGYKIDGKYLKN